MYLVHVSESSGVLFRVRLIFLGVSGISARKCPFVLRTKGPHPCLASCTTDYILQGTLVYYFSLFYLLSSSSSSHSLSSSTFISPPRLGRCESEEALCANSSTHRYPGRCNPRTAGELSLLYNIRESNKMGLRPHPEEGGNQDEALPIVSAHVCYYCCCCPDSHSSYRSLAGAGLFVLWKLILMHVNLGFNRAAGQQGLPCVGLFLDQLRLAMQRPAILLLLLLHDILQPDRSECATTAVGARY